MYIQGIVYYSICLVVNNEEHYLVKLVFKFFHYYYKCSFNTDVRTTFRLPIIKLVHDDNNVTNIICYSIFFQ